MAHPCGQQAARVTSAEWAAWITLSEMRKEKTRVASLSSLTPSSSPSHPLTVFSSVTPGYNSSPVPFKSLRLYLAFHLTLQSEQQWGQKCQADKQWTLPPAGHPEPRSLPIIHVLRPPHPSSIAVSISSLSDVIFDHTGMKNALQK